MMKVATSKHCVIYKDMKIIIIVLVKSDPNNTGGPETRNCVCRVLLWLCYQGNK